MACRGRLQSKRGVHFREPSQVQVVVKLLSTCKARHPWGVSQCPLQVLELSRSLPEPPITSSVISARAMISVSDTFEVKADSALPLLKKKISHDGSFFLIRSVKDYNGGTKV